MKSEMPFSINEDPHFFKICRYPVEMRDIIIVRSIAFPFVFNISSTIYAFPVNNATSRLKGVALKYERKEEK